MESELLLLEDRKKNYKNICDYFEIDTHIIFNEIDEIVKNLTNPLANHLRVNYNNLYSNQIRLLNENLYLGETDIDYLKNEYFVNEKYKEEFKINILQNVKSVNEVIKEFNSQLFFFKQLNHFDSHVVIIGANGSGKTSLTNKLKIDLGYNGTVISAQRVLNLKDFDSISSYEITANKLQTEQHRDKTYKNLGDFHSILNEFEIVLQYLFAENNSISHRYKQKARESHENSQKIAPPEESKLDLALKIWNSLISHRTLECPNGMSLITSTRGEDKTSYPSIQMSDGEKVLLYLISQVLIAPQSGFIVIDEPEMYLHKTILKKLWNILEAYRDDCIFIYLTHDLDFATSRNTAKKIWVKSYKYPDEWELEDIEASELPEALLFELLGSRNNILFCEGVKGSIDENIYSLLFDNYTIIPVESCSNVINYTKAFNKLKNTNTKASGIIDSDHHSKERLDKLKTDFIYSFTLAEVENLFLDEEFLKLLAKTVLADEGKIVEIKREIIKKLNQDIEVQISNFVSADIDNVFTNTNLRRGNTLEDIKSNYSLFLEEINIDNIYNERKQILEKIVSENDYVKAISIFNNKGLKTIVSSHLGIKDLTEKGLKLLKTNPDALKVLEKYFPQELFI